MARAANGAVAPVGATLVGDLKYGDSQPFRGGRGIGLHAFSLEFPHPTQGEKVVVSRQASFWPVSFCSEA